jgi:hypothetical protein
MVFGAWIYADVAPGKVCVRQCKIYIMITAQEFSSRWEQGELSDLHSAPSPLCKAEAWMLEPQLLSLPLKEFLIQAGLPRQAAPFLSFDGVAGGLQPIYSIYGNYDEWSQADKQRLEPYYVLGGDGGGNPICIDADNEERIVLLDHEDNFRTIQFVNSGIFQLAASLLARRDISDTEEIKRELERIDAEAVKEGNFWAYEIYNLEWFDAHPDE